MKIQNSYIFMKMQSSKQQSESPKDKSKEVTSFIGRNIYSFIREEFPDGIKDSDSDNIFRKEYSTVIKFDSFESHTTFVINEVIENTFVDVIVDCKSKVQSIKTLEYIHEKLCLSNINKRYIQIISYDAVSEYYCNKIYTKLNILERNIRKLLFNIYIVNFGIEYYQATISKELQDEVKSNIQAQGGKDKKEMARLQQFFYSIDYGKLQKILFTPTWTDIDEQKKDDFLKNNDDLSKLSDEDLREKFLQFSPKSDWERFFQEKIKIQNIEQVIKDIGNFINKVAHFKFFYKEDYSKCLKLTKELNSAVLTAIELTEGNDFNEKNEENLHKHCENILKYTMQYKNIIKEIFTPFYENMNTIVSTIDKTYKVFDAVSGVSNVVQESWLNKITEICAFQSRISSIFNQYSEIGSQLVSSYQTILSPISTMSAYQVMTSAYQELKPLGILSSITNMDETDFDCLDNDYELCENNINIIERSDG